MRFYLEASSVHLHFYACVCILTWMCVDAQYAVHVEAGQQP